MYQDFFGFRERPFQLLPNPDYLFLSKCHEEALGHLLYALSHGEGFVEISGEVGTGKTTLCRALLESLGEEVEAAYIFHPKLNPLELLQAVTAEFGIASTAATTREMVEVIHRFLIARKEERKKVVLIIDEAQNLTVDVLEQVRLLSNLETATSKLIQIVLVGQPELNDLLDSRELRQLRQRVSLRCRLRPLTAAETRGYVLYRLSRAAGEPRDDLFTAPALDRIYRYSRGIPRLVNIACDRALLLAYGEDLRTVTGAVARRAVGELEEGNGPRRRRPARPGKPAVAALLCVALLLVGEAMLTRTERGPDPIPVPVQPASAPQEDPPAGPGPALDGLHPPALAAGPGAGDAPSVEAPAPPPVPQPPGREDFLAFLASPPPQGNREAALTRAAGLWEPEEVLQPRFSFLEDDLTYFRLNAQQAGLSVTPVSGGISMLGRLDLPAILEFSTPGNPRPAYLALTRITGDTYWLDGVGPDGAVGLAAEDLYGTWTTRAYVVWRNFLDLDGVIPASSSPEAIVSLKLLLMDMGVEGLDASPTYDTTARRAILAVQERSGIFADGLVGPLTAMALYNLAGTFDIPHVAQTPSEGEEGR